MQDSGIGCSGYVPGININLSSKTDARDKKLSKSIPNYGNTRVRRLNIAILRIEFITIFEHSLKRLMHSRKL